MLFSAEPLSKTSPSAVHRQLLREAAGAPAAAHAHEAAGFSSEERLPAAAAPSLMDPMKLVERLVSALSSASDSPLSDVNGGLADGMEPPARAEGTSPLDTTRGSERLTARALQMVVDDLSPVATPVAPDGWTIVSEAGTGRPYYVSSVLGLTSWEEPFYDAEERQWCALRCSPLRPQLTSAPR